MSRTLNLGLAITGRDAGGRAALDKTGRAISDLEKRTIEANRRVEAETKRFANGVNSRIGPAALVFGVVGAATAAAAEALSELAKMAVDAAPNLKTYSGELSSSDKFLTSLKLTSENTDLGATARLALASWQTLNGELLEFVKNTDQLIARQEERGRNSAAIVDAATEGLQREADLERQYGSFAADNRKKLAEIDEKQHQRWVKRQDERARKAQDGAALANRLFADAIENEEQLEKYRADSAEDERRSQEELASQAMKLQEAERERAQAIQEAADEQIRTTADLAAEQNAAMAETGMQYGRVLGETIGMIVAEKMTAEEAVLAISASMLTAVLDTAEKAIMAYAAQAAAAAASSQAGIPIIGPVLAITASAAVFAMVRAYIGQMTAMAEGGVIRGGVPGRDSVPILGMPGERVLTVEQNKMFERLIGMRGNVPAVGPMGMARGGTVPQATGGGPGLTIVQQNRLAPNRLQNMKLTRDMGRELIGYLRRHGYRPA